MDDDQSGDSSASGDLPRSGAGRTGPAASARVLISFGIGLAVGILVSLVTSLRYGLLAGWLAGAAVFVAWMWRMIWPMDAEATSAHAVQEDPGRKVTDVVMVAAAVASLAAVGLLLVGSSGGTASKGLDAVLSLVSVAVAWTTVHTVFTTRYAHLYYTGKDGGIDFNEDDPPTYSDFAYLAFTIGMTFQVSDTDLKTKKIRATALRQGLLSYLFGAFIIATTINLVAGLSK